MSQGGSEFRESEFVSQ